MLLRIDNRIQFDVSRVTPVTRDKIRSLAEFLNPAYLEAKNRGYSTYRIPRVISQWIVVGGVASLPRGVLDRLCLILREAGIPVELQMATVSRSCKEPLTFRGQLRPDQEQAVAKLWKSRFAVLRAPTGSGKTVIALHLVYRRKQNTLVLVHTKELLDQWRDRVRDFLGVEPGVIGAGQYKPAGAVTVALYQSATKYLSQLSRQIGFVVVDECHRAPSAMFSEVVQAFASKYTLGLSATPYRRDGLTRLIEWYVGPEVFSIEPLELQEQGHILTPKLISRTTSFYTVYDRDSYSKILSAIAADESRNRQIARDAIDMVLAGHTVLILTDRVAHVERLQRLIVSLGMPCASLVGSHSKEQRALTVAAVRSGVYRILVATGQLIGEGFDCANLSCLVLAMPLRYEGRLVQYIGRILRKGSNKVEPVIIDYRDVRVPVLAAQFRARLKAYRKHGVEEVRDEGKRLHRL